MPIFDALVWDEEPRLESWLQTYLHVEESEYVRAVGPRFLISAVARIYRPGCKVDHVLVLEGPQGRLKSEALRTLAVKDGWFTDRLSHVGGKDAAMEIAGLWFIEFAEMDAARQCVFAAIAQKRVASILTRMGFAKHRPRTSEGRKQRYQRDPIPPKSDRLTGDHG